MPGIVDDSDADDWQQVGRLSSGGSGTLGRSSETGARTSSNSAPAADTFGLGIGAMASSGSATAADGSSPAAEAAPVAEALSSALASSLECAVQLRQAANAAATAALQAEELASLAEASSIKAQAAFEAIATMPQMMPMASYSYPKCTVTQRGVAAMASAATGLGCGHFRIGSASDSAALQTAWQTAEEARDANLEVLGRLQSSQAATVAQMISACNAEAAWTGFFRRRAA